MPPSKMHDFFLITKMEKPITELNRSETTSGEIVAGSEDLIEEIFVRLPADSLARCKWVSKQWLSFITNNSFIKQYTISYPPSLSGLFLIPKQPNLSRKIHYTSLNHSKSRLTFSDFLNSRGFQIVHSCNGLLICHSEKSNHAYSVVNPTTRQVKLLPTCLNIANHKSALNLVFSPLESPRYKVVSLRKQDGYQGIYDIAEYLSEIGEWSFSEEPVFASVDFDFNNGVSCNGAIHWLNNTISGLYLELNTKTLKEMPELPRREEPEMSQYRFKYFGKSKDCLFYIISRPLLHYYEIYQMKEDYSGWVLIHRLNLKVLLTKHPSIARNFRLHPLFTEYECDVLSVNHSGNEKDVEIVLSIPGEVVVFNLEKKTSITVRDPVFRPSDVTIWYKIHSVYEYFETLSLV